LSAAVRTSPNHAEFEFVAKKERDTVLIFLYYERSSIERSQIKFKL